MSDFARRMLEKYGWKEGQGLGRLQDGIQTPLRPTLKMDNAGIGHQGDKEQFTSRWWEQAYNEVAQNITIKSNENGVKVKKKKSKKKLSLPPVATYGSLSYNSFIKTSILTNDGTVALAESSDPFLSEDECGAPKIPLLSDEDIFKACGGRTVHKGARHGMTLGGKLARLQRQEEELVLGVHNPPEENVGLSSKVLTDDLMENMKNKNIRDSFVKEEIKKRKEHVEDLKDRTNSLSDKRKEEEKKLRNYEQSDIGPLSEATDINTNQTRMLNRKRRKRENANQYATEISQESTEDCTTSGAENPCYSNYVPVTVEAENDDTELTFTKKKKKKSKKKQNIIE